MPETTAEIPIKALQKLYAADLKFINDVVRQAPIQTEVQSIGVTRPEYTKLMNSRAPEGYSYFQNFTPDVDQNRYSPDEIRTKVETGEWIVIQPAYSISMQRVEGGHDGVQTFAIYKKNEVPIEED